MGMGMGKGRGMVTREEALEAALLEVSKYAPGDRRCWCALDGMVPYRGHDAGCEAARAAIAMPKEPEQWHIGDPCRRCGVSHDKVPLGSCRPEQPDYDRGYDAGLAINAARLLRVAEAVREACLHPTQVHPACGHVEQATILALDLAAIAEKTK